MKRFLTLKKVQEWAGIYFKLLIVSALASWAQPVFLLFSEKSLLENFRQSEAAGLSLREQKLLLQTGRSLTLLPCYSGLRSKALRACLAAHPELSWDLP